MRKVYLSAVVVGFLFYAVTSQPALSLSNEGQKKSSIKSSSDSFDDGFDLLDIVVVSGGTLHIRSGATLNINSGATYTNNASTTTIGGTDNTSKFVVEQNDGTNVFAVDTTNADVTVSNASELSVFAIDTSATTVTVTTPTNHAQAFRVVDSAAAALFTVDTDTKGVKIRDDLTFMGGAGTTMSIIDIAAGSTALQIFAPGGAAHAKTLKIRGDVSVSGDFFNPAMFELQSGFKQVAASLDAKERLISQIQNNVQNVSKEVVTLKEVVNTSSSPLGLLASDFPKNVTRKEVKQLVSGSQSLADTLHTHTNFPLNVTFDKDVFSKGQRVTLNPLKGSKHSLVSFSAESFKPLLSIAGISQLNGGEVTISLDPDYLELVAVDRTHPFLVQVTPLGECNGLQVSQLFEDKFTVKELHQGSSRVSFSWRVEATKKGFEEMETSATLSDYQQMKLSK